MENRPRPNGSNKNRLMARLDRATRDVNAFLVVVAIGLATLDFTAYCAFKITEAMPPAGIAVAATAPIFARPAAGAAPAHAVADHRGAGQPQPTAPGFHEATNHSLRH